jgi:hypothetical protein
VYTAPGGLPVPMREVQADLSHRIVHGDGMSMRIVLIEFDLNGSLLYRGMLCELVAVEKSLMFV